MATTFKVGVVGFGPAFNMGPRHIDSILAHEGFELAAVCDLSPECLETAKEQYPGIETFTDAMEMLDAVELNLCVIITPHNTHAPLALACLNRGINVVTEKPMAITTQEVQDMMAAAKANNVMLSTFHNRRWDADFMVLRDLVKSGIIGRVFRIEAGTNRYGKPRAWWRSNKEISGGAIYDWGAHFTDWILNIAEGNVDWVTGYQVKNPAWSEFTNEDHSEYTAHFDSGCGATLFVSNMSAIDRPRWTVRGEKGSIVSGADAFTITQIDDDGRSWTTQVRYDTVKSDWHAYYVNVCTHLRDGVPLVITAESAARVICILDCANESAMDGGAPKVPAYR